jgi:hypothetical protein
LAVGAGAEEDKLAATIEAIWDGVKNQLDTFLVIEATDERNDGAELVAEPEAISKGLFIGVFIIDGAGGITFGDMGIDIGVPDFVIEAVEDAAKFSMVHVENSLQAHAKVAVADFVGVTRGNRGDEIGIDDAAFHQVDGTVAMVVGEAVVGHEMARIQTDLAQDVFAMNALVAKIVKGEADARMAHAEMLIDFVKQDGDERGLPVVAMDDVGMLVGLEHEFERCAGEESETLDVIMIAIEDAAIEKVVVGMRIDEKAFQPFHEPEVNVAMNPLVMVRDPEIAVGFGEAPNAVVTHAIILGENDLDRVTTNAKFTGEALDNITEAANFRGGSAFGCDHYDEHGGKEVT